MQQDLGPGNVWFAAAFALIMMVVAALVSAAADRMGHRAARRKLRIGKLRPRHVSTLIAVLSGVLISLLTVLVMFVLWKDFYRALTQWDNLNGKLTEVQGQIEAKERLVAEAEQKTQLAQSALAQAEADIAGKSKEIQQKTREIVATRSKLSGAQTELRNNRAKLNDLIARRDRAQAELARARRDADEARQSEEQSEFQLGQKQELVRLAQQEFERLDQQVQQLRAEINRAQTGTRLYAVGQQLGFIRVQGGAGLESALSGKLAELKTQIEAQGLEFDPQSRDKVIEFIAAFPDDSADYLVQIVSAENVFEGDQLLLDFNYRELAPLVGAGTALLDITIYGDHAVILGLEGVRQEVSVPAQFDRDSIVDLAVAAQNVFTRGARAAGFVFEGRDIPSPVEKLTDVADELITRARPVRIQFVSKRSATALEGSYLEDAELHLTSPQRIERAEPPPRPEPEPEPPVEETAPPAAPEPPEAEPGAPEDPSAGNEDGDAG